MRRKNENMHLVDADKFNKIIEPLGLTCAQISRACGVADTHISHAIGRGRISDKTAARIKYIFGVDVSEAYIDTPAKPAEPVTPVTPITPVTPVTPVNTCTCDTEKIITAIGQATGIISNQLNEIIKLLKAINESRDAEIQKVHRSITDSMVSAVILGLQESKGVIGDGVKLGLTNSGELRNLINAVRGRR